MELVTLFSSMLFFVQCQKDANRKSFSLEFAMNFNTNTNLIQNFL